MRSGNEASASGRAAPREDFCRSAAVRPRARARRVAPCAALALLLRHRQPDQRLRPGNEDAPLAQRVFVVRVDGGTAGSTQHGGASCFDLVRALTNVVQTLVY